MGIEIAGQHESKKCQKNDPNDKRSQSRCTQRHQYGANFIFSTDSVNDNFDKCK